MIILTKDEKMTPMETRLYNVEPWLEFLSGCQKALFNR